VAFLYINIALQIWSKIVNLMLSDAAPVPNELTSLHGQIACYQQTTN